MNLKQEFEQYIQYCQNRKKLSHHTIKAYRIDWKQFITFKTGIELNKENISEYVEHLHTLYKPKTVHRKIASLKAFAHYLYSNDLIWQNPFDKLNTSFKEPLRLPRIIPNQTIQKILSTTYKNMQQAKSEFEKASTLRNTAMIELLFATGARIFEVCSLKTNDIDLANRTVRIFGKGSKERVIQIENDDVVSVLKKYKNSRGQNIHPEGYFFLNNRGNRFSEQSARNVITKLEKQIGSEIHITPHMFRHSVATMLLEEDVDIRYIQRILGHSSIKTTEIYTFVTSSKQKEILRTKHPRNKMVIFEQQARNS